MRRTAVSALAALLVAALGIALGVHFLGSGTSGNGQEGQSPTMEPMQSFTPYPTLTATDGERKDFRARLAKLAIKRLAEYYGADKDKNVVFSPVCSMSTLGMMLPAADGSTEQAILDELCMSGRKPEWVLNNFREYFSGLKEMDKDITKGPEQAGNQPKRGGKPIDYPIAIAEEYRKHMGLFRFANAVWTDSRLPVEASYGRNLAGYLSGEAFSTEISDSTRGVLDE